MTILFLAAFCPISANKLCWGKKGFDLCGSFTLLFFRYISLMILAPKPWLHGLQVKTRILPPFSSKESTPDLIAQPVIVLICLFLIFILLLKFLFLSLMNKFIFSIKEFIFSWFDPIFIYNFFNDKGQKGSLISPIILILTSSFSI